MEINLDINTPEVYSDEQIIEAVARYRGNWTEESTETTEEVFLKVLSNIVKNIMKDCLVTQVAEQERLSIESNFNEAN